MKMEEQNQEIVRYLRKQYTMLKISAACMVGMLVIVLVAALILVPRLMLTFGQIDTVMGEMHTAMENLNSGIETFQDAASEFGGLDIAGMNEAINDLGAVVEPLSKLFSR